MTVYNGASYVAEAVESVLRQTFTDFELLVIDDASTDDSMARLRRYTDPRLRLLGNDRNQGQAWSLNRGLQLARAPYVARLDQDDMCLPERLERQVAVLDKEPAVTVVGTLMCGIDQRGRRQGLLGRPLRNYGSFVGSLLLGLCPVCHPSVMFRRDVVVELGGYDPSFSPAEDVELWTRLALAQHNAYVIPEPLALYRVHEGQQSVTKATTQRQNIRRAQQRVLEPFCPAEALQDVTRLLWMDGAFWTSCRSKDGLVRAFEAFLQTLKNLQSHLGMTPEEQAALIHMVDRWLGPGVRLAPRIRRWPGVLFYPTICVLSPLLVPNVRSTLARFARPTRRLRGVMAADSSLGRF
jgi:glycosyltransferase involved in cell wall biosynthesis